MNLSIEFRPQAEAELYKSYDWYEEQEPGLGDRFRLELEETIALVETRPNSFPFVEETRFRRALLDKFPFVIIFTQENSTLVIASVFHTSRNPANLMDRIG